MNIKKVNNRNQQQALYAFKAARELYLARSFAEARSTMQRYRQTIDYSQFEKSDRRPKISKPEITIVIVSYQTKHTLLDCLQSVFEQRGPIFEIILVDNGGNEIIHAELAKLRLLWIKPPINLLPSEGRNIGTHFASSNLVVFLDDDALMTPGYLAEVSRAMGDESILFLRGRAFPKKPLQHAQPPSHYDLGDVVCPAELNLEGNSVFRRQAFMALQGFDPLLWGHEGKEISLRCCSTFPKQQILYWPQLVIHHDYAQEGRLAAKRDRQALAKDYLQYLKENTLNVGASILVRAGKDLIEVKEFLESLVMHNTYAPIELIISANDSRSALEVARFYLGKFLIRVLPKNSKSLIRIAQQSFYENFLIVDLPTEITSDVLSTWIQKQQSELTSVFLNSKKGIERLQEVSIDASFERIKEVLNQPNLVDTVQQGARFSNLIDSTVKKNKPNVNNELISNSTINKPKVLVVTPRMLGILGTPGTYFFVEALVNWAEVVVLCNSEGRYSEKTPQVHTPPSTLTVVEVPFSKDNELELSLCELAKTFSPDIIHLMIWQKWPDLAVALRKWIPNGKIVLDVKTPLLADGEIRRRVQSSGNSHKDLIDLVLPMKAGIEKTWIPANDRPVFEYPLGLNMEHINGTNVLTGRRKLKCVYIGSIHPKRQLDRLLWLMANIDQKLRSCYVLDIYGSGGSRQELLQHIEINKLVGKVNVLDPLPQQELFTKLTSYDVGIAWVPWGEYELSPSLKFIEYAASQLTIIASDTLAHKQNVKEGFNAHLFKNNPDSFGHALELASEEIYKMERNDKNYSLACARDWKIISLQFFIYSYERLLLDNPSSQYINASLPSLFSNITAIPEYFLNHPLIVQNLKKINSNKESYEYF